MSVTLLWKRMHISSIFFYIWLGYDSSFFQRYHRYEYSKGTPSAGTLNTRGSEKFAIFDSNRRLSQKRYEKGQ